MNNDFLINCLVELLIIGTCVLECFCFQNQTIVHQLPLSVPASPLSTTSKSSVHTSARKIPRTPQASSSMTSVGAGLNCAALSSSSMNLATSIEKQRMLRLRSPFKPNNLFSGGNSTGNNSMVNVADNKHNLARRLFADEGVDDIQLSGVGDEDQQDVLNKLVIDVHNFSVKLLFLTVGLSDH
jgi:hypothetical protein